MNRWHRVLETVCEEAKGKELYVIEGTADLDWFGANLSDFCSKIQSAQKDTDIYKLLKANTTTAVNQEGFIAYVSPVNFQVDIYESHRKRFLNSSNSSRPFSITREGFRIGFFKDKEEAVDFFLAVRRRLGEKGITLHLFY